jgi:hypothetical protein
MAHSGEEGWTPEMARWLPENHHTDKALSVVRMIASAIM